MDLVLLKAVETLGPEGTIGYVKPGFARNYLLPRGLAVPATPEQLKAIEEMKRQRAKKFQRVHAEADTLRQKLESRSLTLKLTVGDDEKPFGSVTTHDLVEALEREGLSIEKHAVQLLEPIKTLGVFDVPIRLHAEVTATLKVWVVKA